MPTDAKTYKEELREVVEQADMSAWKISKQLDHPPNWLSRKLNGSRPTKKSDVAAVRWLVEC